MLAIAAESPLAALEAEAMPAEGLGPWIEAVLATLGRRGASERAHLIYAIGLPAGAIVAGARFAAELGAPLIADLGDPWPEAAGYPATERTAALGSAAALVTTTEELAARLRPDLRAGTEILIAPNGGELRRRAPRPPGAAPLFVHLGAINAGRVDPRPAFAALAALEAEGRIELRSHTTGFHLAIDELAHGSGGRLPMLDHREALDLTARASAALVLGNDDPAQLPSKAFEIACTETWALCVGGDGEDPARALLERTGHAVAAAANTEEAVRAAAEEILALEVGGVRPAPDPRLTWEDRIREVSALLQRVLERR